MPQPEISAAIKDCLNDCLGSATPIARLATWCVKLKDRGWDEQEIHAVETAVVRLLTGILQPAPACPKCKWMAPVIVFESAVETLYRCRNCQHQWRDAARATEAHSEAPSNSAAIQGTVPDLTFAVVGVRADGTSHTIAEPLPSFEEAERIRKAVAGMADAEEYATVIIRSREKPAEN